MTSPITSSPITLVPIENDDILPPLSPLSPVSPLSSLSINDEFIIKKVIRFKYREKEESKEIKRFYPFLNELELKICEIKRSLDSPLISNKFMIACVDNSKYEYWTYILK